MDETREIQNSLPPESDNGSDRMSSTTKIGIGVGIVVILAILVVLIVLLVKNPETTEVVRDLFIIVLALESLVIGTLLVILIYQLIVLTRMLRDDLKPMIESTQETLSTVKGTATFVSQRVTKPAITASSYITGIGRSINVLVKMLPRRRATPESSMDETTTQGKMSTEQGD